MNSALLQIKHRLISMMHYFRERIGMMQGFKALSTVYLSGGSGVVRSLHDVAEMIRIVKEVKDIPCAIGFWHIQRPGGCNGQVFRRVIVGSVLSKS
jgi:hypothetical protein